MMEDFPRFLEIHRGSIRNDSNFHTSKATIKANTFKRDEIHYVEYVRADIYYESIKLLNEKLQIKMRSDEIDEKISAFLLEF